MLFRLKNIQIIITEVTITEVRFNQRINQQGIFILVHISWYSEQSIQFLICSFTYIRDVITKIKIIIYGEP